MVRSSWLSALIAAVSLPALAQQPAVKNVPAAYTLPTSGEKVYQAYCASCHGLKGLGDGPVAPSLKAPVPDLTILTRQNQGEFPGVRISESIRGASTSRAHGTADMPVWGPVFRSIDSRSEGATNIRVHNLVKYIETLQAK